MASPTKVVETKRRHKREKLLKRRLKRVRRELAKVTKNTDPELRRFVPGAING